PRIADVLAESARHANDHRRREAIGRAPPQRAGVVELFRGRVGVFAKLNFGNRHETGDRHSRGAPDDALLRQARVEHALVAELLLQTFRHEVHAALSANVLTEYEDLGIDLELASQRPANGLGETNHVAGFVPRLASAEVTALGAR